jgi:hypothetical protein
MKFYLFLPSLYNCVFCPEECTSCGQSSVNGVTNRGLYICSGAGLSDVPYGLPKDKIIDFRLNGNKIEKILQYDFRNGTKCIIFCHHLKR